MQERCQHNLNISLFKVILKANTRSRFDSTFVSFPSITATAEAAVSYMFTYTQLAADNELFIVVVYVLLLLTAMART